MVVDYVLGNDFEAGLIDLIRLIAEDELLVIVGFLHGSLHRRDLGVSFLDRRDNVLLLVGVVCTCIGDIQVEELGERNGFGVGGSAGMACHGIVNECHRRFKAYRVFTNVGALISHDILVEGWEIAAVLRFEVPSVMAKTGEYLCGIGGVQTLGFIDLHSRHDGENADVIIDLHRNVIACLVLTEKRIPK